MKRIYWFAFCLCLAAIPCRAQFGSGPTLGGPTSTFVETNRYTSLDPLGTLQTSDSTLTNPPIIIRTNGPVLGLNPVATTGIISIQSTGAVAQFAPHKAFFAPNPNTMEAVQLTIPDRAGQLLLKSHLVGLGFWDSTTGETVVFATPQDCVGEISGSTVRYTNALDGTDAEITYTYAWDNFDQTIVLRKKIPEPSALNMTGDPTHIRLVVITEFIDPPEPLRMPASIDLTSKNQSFGIQSENYIPDETLFFGSMRMGGGKMLLLGNSTVEVPSAKTYMTVEGNHYLVEFCPWLLVKALVDSLPSGTLHAKVKARGELKSAIAQMPKPSPDKSKKRMVLAKPRSSGLAFNDSSDSRPGVVLDYLLVSSHLIDINLSGAIPEKLGVAAVGQYTNDFWITWLSSYSSLANLTWSDQSTPNSGVGLAISGISGGWGNGANDRMYNSYLYGGSGGSLTLTLTNLPTNVFNFYLYGHAGRDIANSSFKLLRASTQIAYKGTTLWGNTWNSTNWEPGLQYQVFKNIAVTNQTIQIQIPSGGDGIPYVNGLQIVESAAVPPPPTNITNLFNVNFGSRSTNKLGFAAVGLTVNDYWNGYYNSSNLTGSIVGLTNASGTASPVGLTVLNSPGIGSWNGGGNGDGMYTSFVYATNGGNVTFLLTNLTTGNYDFYLYGHGNTNDANTIFQLWSGGRDWDVRGTTIWGSGYSNSTAWDESQQYIVYHDIPVDSNQVVTIVAGHDPYGSANLNGMQVVYKGSYDTNSDGLPDVWKWYYFGSTSPTSDPDNDKLSNFREYQLGTDPNKSDTDGNGVTDSNDSERVWVEDYTPARGIENDSTAASPSWSGAFTENWNWGNHWGTGWNGSGVSAYSWNPASSCHCMHVSDVHSGIHQHWFDKSDINMMANTGEVLITYVNIDPNNVPSEIMLQWYTTETNGLDSWEHRAYWGSNAISWGTTNTASCWYVTNLPTSGSWKRLEVPASAVGLEGKVIQGMAFTLYNGRAAFDRAGKFIPDMDGNGLTDSWEKQYFGNIGQDPNGDPDKDGLSNLQEFLGVTNPTNCNPPQIWGQPQNTCGYQGGSAYFIVTPTGSVLTNYNFQWRLGGTNITSATNYTLVLTNVQSTNLGNYTVVITNVCGSTTSSVATLTFCPPPYVQITAPTNNSTFTAPAFVTIQATATNTDSSITNVQFYRGDLTLLGNDTIAPYFYTWTAAAGLYSLTAVAYDSHGLISTSSPVSITVGSGCNYTNNTFSSNNAFGNGFLMNLNYTNSFGRLQLNAQATPFPFINVACGSEGTLVRVDTSSGQILGEYRTAPTNKPSFPGHVAVDRYGNAWVANWDEAGNRDGTGLGSITRIGVVIGGTRGDGQTNQFGQVTNFTANPNGQYLKPPFLYSTAIDRNGDGYIKTSTGLNNVLTWPTNTVGGSTGSVFNADDELIINYIRVPAQLASALAIDANNDLWVGGYCDFSTPDLPGNDNCGTKVHVKVSGVTGQVLTNPLPIIFTNVYNGTPYGGFEGLIGPNGFLWSSGGANQPSAGNFSLVTFDPVVRTNLIRTQADGPGNYGMAIDPATGNIWVASYSGSNVSVYSQSGAFLAAYPQGSAYGSGLAIDNSSNVWVAHGPFGSDTTVSHLRTDGTLLSTLNLQTGSCPGVGPARELCYDAAGKLWALSATTPHVVRFNPVYGTNELCLQIHSGHQTRGDLTGQKLLSGTAPSGVWSVTYTNGATNQIWGTLTWTASTADTNQIRVEVRAANTYDKLSTNTFQLAFDSVQLTNVVGRYLEIRVTLIKPAGVSSSPWLHDLTFDCSQTNRPSVQITYPVNNQGFLAITNITVQATASSPNGSISHVDFFEDSTNFLGTAISSPYQIGWNPVYGGTHILTAQAFDTLGSNAISSPVTILVRKPPTVTITTPTNNSIIAALAPWPLNTNITATAVPDGSPTITNVVFYVGTNVIGSDTNSPYSVTWSITNSGSYALTAKAADSTGAIGISPTVHVTVFYTNQPPTVDPGSNQTIRLPDVAYLYGLVSDDGLPVGSHLAIQWSRTNGPGTCTFANSNRAATTATFSTPGTNVLRLWASDSQYAASNTVTIIVLPANAAPTVSAGTNQTVVLAARYAVTNDPIFSSSQVTSRGSRGKEFWLGFPQNDIGQPALTLFIACETNAFGCVSVPGLAFFTNFSVAAGLTAAIPIPKLAQVDSNNLVQLKGIHVTSDQDISVYGLTEQHWTSDAFLALPVTSLGTNYFVLGWSNWFEASQLLIVGTAKNSIVTIVPSATDDTGNWPTGQTNTINLNEGETFQLKSISGDLSGSIVHADKPIAVFGGNQCAYVPSCGSCDVLVEQIPPTNSWGRQFYTVPLATRTGGDIFQILAVSDGTTVWVNGISFAMNAREVHALLLTNASEIVSDKPVLLAQYARGQDCEYPPPHGQYYMDPLMMIVPPCGQFFNDYTISTPTIGFPTNFANLVISSTDQTNIHVLKDGALLASTNFFLITNGFYGAQIRITNGTHKFNSAQPFGVFVYGWDEADGYGYPGGMSVASLANTASITLRPSQTTNEVSTTTCLIAAVTNQNGEPVVGARVDFQTSGSNSISGVAFTDDAGQAHWCYVGANLGLDSIRASIGNVVAFATNIWDLPSFILRGYVSDDGLPSNILSTAWTTNSGPPGAIIANTSATNTLVHVIDEGFYTLRLTAGDSELTNSDEVAITVTRNRAPLVYAGTNQVTKTGSVTLYGTASDDGLPQGKLISTWTKVSGPGNVIFSQPSTTNAPPTTTATVSKPGIYVLRLIGTDSQATVFSDVTITSQIDPQRVQCGDVLNGTLGSGDRLSIQQSASYADYYVYSGQSNELLTVSMISTNFDTYLVIRDTQLRVQAEDDDSTYTILEPQLHVLETTNSVISYVLPADGDYIIEATSFAASSGSYSLAFRCGDIQITSPTNGTTFLNGSAIDITVNASATNRLKQYTVSIDGNPLLYDFQPTPHTFHWTGVAPGQYTLIPSAQFYDVNGYEYTVTGTPVTITVGSPTLALSPVSACVGLLYASTSLSASFTGTNGAPLSATNFTFVVSGRNPQTNIITTNTSAVTFTYQGTNSGRDAITATAKVNGQTYTAPLVERNWAYSIGCDTVMLGTLATNDGASTRFGYADYFAFSGVSNDTVRITLSSSNFDTFLYVRNANCQTVATNDDQIGTDSQIMLTLTNSGLYVIEATSLLPRQTGYYRLYLECNPVDIQGIPELAVLKGSQVLSNYGTVNFGTTTVGTSNQVVITLTNSGTAPLYFAGFMGTTGDFILTNLPPNPLPARTATNLTLQFNATTNGIANGTFTFGHVATNCPSPFTLNLIGIANTSGAGGPVVNLSLPTNNAAYSYGDTIPLLAVTNFAAGMVVTQVEFIVDIGNAWYLLGRNTNLSGPYTNNWRKPSPGNYSVFARARDNQGRFGVSSNAVVQVLPSTNEPPVAVDDYYAVLVNTTTNLNVLNNDFDTNGNALKIIGITNHTGTTVKIINNGTAISYTPKRDTCGSDWFTYKISDGHGGTDWAIVFIDIPVPYPPWVTLTSPGNTTVTAGTPLTISATAGANIGTVSKVVFYDGEKPLRTFTNAPYSFTWNGIVGPHLFYAIVTDSEQQQNISGTATVTVTANPSDIAPTAAIANLTNQVWQVNNNWVTNEPIIREGLYGLIGTANDADAGDAVSYRLNLLLPDGSFAANMTPGTLDADGFHAGRVSNASLGTNDFTHIQNGPYIMQLVVRGGYQERTVEIPFILESNLKIGQFSFSQQDLVIPANGIPLTVVRTYNSLNLNKGDFGYGWTWAINSMDVALDEVRADIPDLTDPDDTPFSERVGGGRDVTLTLPDGKRTTFFYYLDGPTTCSGGDETKSCYFAKYQSAPGISARLGLQGDNRLNGLLGIAGLPPYWQDDSPLVPWESFDFRGWVLTNLDGTQYFINREDLDKHDVTNGVALPYTVHAYGKPYLSYIRDRNGNEIHIYDGAIVQKDSLGHTNRQVVFQRNDDGLISAIFDPISQLQPTNSQLPSTKYEYDSNQNLMNVLQLVDRATAKYVTNSFTYTNVNYQHYITGIIDPRGITVGRSEYDDTGKLKAIVDANGKRTEINHDMAGSVERVIDRRSYTTSYRYDLRGNVKAITNAISQVTLMDYDDKNNKIAETNAFGTAFQTWTTNAYDTNGNVIVTVDALHTNRFVYDITGNPVGQTDPLGNVTTNLFDGSGNLTNVIRMDSANHIVDQTFSTYSSGKLVEMRNGSNQITASLSYDSSGNLSGTTNANGFANTFSYDANGNQTTNTYVGAGPNGNVTLSNITQYDDAGRAIRTIDGDGNTNQTFYNGAGKVDFSIDKFGNTNSFLYNARGNVIRTIGPDGLAALTVYNDDANPILTTDWNQITGTRTDYDPLGRVTNTVRLMNVEVDLAPDTNNPGFYITKVASPGTPFATNSTVYDAAGRIFSRTGPDRKTTTYDYYSDGQLKSVTDPLTHTTFYEYDAGGHQKSIADALNHTNRFEIDVLGRVTKTVFHDGTWSSNVFNFVGQRVGQIDQATLRINYNYDVSGQLTNVVMPSVPDPEASFATTNATWIYAYDLFGRLSATVDAKGRGTTNTYDAVGRQLTRRLPLGQTETNVFDAKGRLWRHIDFKGQTNEFVYDKLGRTIAKFYFANGSIYPSNAICYKYDALGRLKQITERSGDGVTTNACDGYTALVGFPVKHYAKVSPWRVVWSYAVEHIYVTAGILLTILAWLALPKEFRRLLIQFYLRGGWRLSHIPLPAVRRLYLPSVWNRVVSLLLIVALFHSDPRLEILWSAKAECNFPQNYSTETVRLTEFAYDFDGRLTQVNSPEGVINYEYDLATGRQTSTCTTNSFVEYGYDELGRLKTVAVLRRNAVEITPEVTTYTYTPVGSRESVTLPNGIVTSYQYDSLNRLTNLTHSITGTSLASFSYQLHPTGRRTNAVETIKQENGSYVTNTLSWQYDGMYRLTNEVSISSAPGGTATYTNTYQYDKVGNRFAKIHYQTNTVTTVTNQFNNNDQLLKEVTLASGVPNATNSYAYDSNGSLVAKTNMTSGGTATTLYGYDLKNKLSAAWNVGGSTTNLFLYNDSGIRVRSTTSGVSKNYLIDANNHTGYAQVLEEFYAIGSLPDRSYVIGDDVLGQSGNSTADPRWILYDGNGSTRQMANPAAAVSAALNYDAYGNGLDNSTHPEDTSLRYCGEQFDSTLGMYNLRARYYDPVIGRFNQQDTFEGSNFDPQSLHKYTYAKCDPVNCIDPSGLSGIAVNLIGILVITAILLIVATLVLPRPAIGPYTGPVVWVSGSGSTSTGTGQAPETKPAEGPPPPMPWPPIIPKPQGRWGYFIHYSHKPPSTFQFGILPPPRAWVTDILNAGLDADTAYFDFGLAVRPKYEYLFRINIDMLGPPDNSTPKRRIQYEVLSPTGTTSLMTWRTVRPHP
jgi:RHS repeat-associated protein